MKPINISALHAPTGDARLSAAQDLVQRTLARHGLVPQTGRSGALPSMDSLLTRFAASHVSAATAPQPLPVGATFRQDTHACASGSRSYLTYRPASAAKGVAGVVLMLHGCTQSPADFAAGTGMNALAEQHRLVVIYPAQSRGDNAQSCWNWFSRGDQQRGRGEPAILAGLTRQVCAEYGLGRDRTFVAGLSAGAAMAVILGQTYADVFSAVGAHSGLPFGSARDVASAFAAMAGSAAAPSLPVRDGALVRTIVFHGTADATVHPMNGDGIVRQAMDSGARLTVDTTQHGRTAGRAFVRQVSTAPTGLPVLEHWAIEGLGHAWSGGRPQGSYTDPKGPDASSELIRFFCDACPDTV